MRWTFPKARRTCGLDETFEIRSEEDYHFAIRVWRDLTVQARRANDDNRAAELSAAKEVFKKRYNRLFSIHCPRCGEVKSHGAVHCQLCSHTVRYHNNEIWVRSVNMKEHEIEEAPVLIPPRMWSTGVLTGICRKMATTGQVGDSFITNKQPTSVKNVCRMMGMEVTIRIANIEEKDPKKRRWRVWRTDGKDMEEVNELIRKRLAGEPVPPSQPCKPPPPGTLPDRHKPKGGKPGPKRAES